MSVTVAISENPLVTVPSCATASLAPFREWAGDNDLPEKAELCFYHGEVLLRWAKNNFFSHVAVKTEISRVLTNIVKEQKNGTFLTDDALFTNEKADLSCNPDATFISNDAIKSKRIKLIAGKEGFVELLGSADMVLEVVSDSSERKDNQTLFETYFEVGVSEYWLVDARAEEIEFLIYSRGTKKFAVVKKQAGGWMKSAVFGKSFRLIHGTDATGNPEFTLEVK